ncbi:MFS transporter [Oculatella sp. LEGE 06141]|uniref:MFS transporter n=1 Tax=Oculatella sp. LEGE 06141 TaxID=1828648 RepID=UPI0018823464|nr:MFS transporter [Oculatella sp. LEGE 06141]MBE9180387.1 MFS transporter [Oculatella sp. LEGE 06141]
MFPPASSASNSSFIKLLRNQSFLVLWFGQALSQIADKIFFVLLIALLTNYQPAEGIENSMRSTLMVAFTLPAIFFGVIAGIVVDRSNKKWVLTTCNFGRGLLLLALPFLPQLFVVLLAIAFLQSTLTQFFAPAELAAIPLVVKRQDLLSANALFTTTMMGALIVGFAVGEPLLSLAKEWSSDYGQVLLVSSCYLLAGALLQTLSSQSVGNAQSAIATHPWSDFKAGLRYLKHDRLVSNAMLQLMILYAVCAVLTVLTIQLAEEVGLKPTQFGFLLAAAGIGMVVGAGTLGHWGDRFPHRFLTLVGFITVASVLLVFTFIQTLWLGLGLSLLLGVGAALVAIPMQTLIQQQTPESMRGKVFGFQNNIINIALSLPLALAGPLTDAIGLRAVFIGMSVTVAIGGTWAWQTAHPSQSNGLE